jgi:general secretion pathway protein D
MKRYIQGIIAACIAGLSITAAGQTSRPASRPTTLKFVMPTTRISLKFTDAQVVSVLDQLSKDYGFQIAVNEAGADTRITVISQTPITADEALSLLNSALKGRGFVVIKMGMILKILTRQHAKESPPVFYGVDVDEIPESDDLRTQVMPVGSLDAVKLRQDLAPMIASDVNIMANAASNSLVITDVASGIRRVAKIVNALNQRTVQSTGLRVVALKYADAESAAKLITTLFDSSNEQTNTASSGRGGRGGGGGGGPPGFIMAGFGPGGGGPPGFGGSSNSSGDQATKVKVNAAADQRTNTVVITGPPETLSLIITMLEQIDSNPSAEQTVFFYRVKFGQAVDMAATLNGLFQQTGTPSSSRNSGNRGSNNRNSFGATNTGFGGGGTGGGRGGGGAGGGFGGGGGGGAGGFGGGGGFGGNGGFGGFGNNAGFGGNNAGGFSGGGARGGLTGSSGSAFGSIMGQVYVVADQDTNSLLVWTTTKLEKDVRAIIAELDRPIPQVLIKVLVAEVTHDNSADFGVDFSVLNTRANGNGQSFGQTFGQPGTGLVINFLENNLNATLHALAQKNKLDVLSRPYILASDNQEAYVMVGQQVPIVTSNTLTALGQTVSNYSYQSVGIILDVIPHINPDGVVTLQVMPEISQLTAQTVTVGLGVNVPVIASRQASSIVAVKDGETVVIGGLMQDQKTVTINKVPLLGDIPLIGYVFSRTQYDKSKTELLLFLTPHVASEPGLLKAMSDDEMKGTQLTPQAVSPGTFQDQMKGMERGAAH